MVPSLSNGGYLMWICKELMREHHIRPEDCFPVSKNQRISEVPTTLRWRDIRLANGGGGETSYVEVV
jgi:hypothetical protein